MIGFILGRKTRKKGKEMEMEKGRVGDGQWEDWKCSSKPGRKLLYMG